jgi:protocatechuate 3,4-dioxygenase beta subunit
MPADYRHKKDQYIAPIGQFLADVARCHRCERCYFFRTIKPGPYPVRSGSTTDWRPAHIHFSLSGDGWAQRLITQMYFEEVIP